MTDTTVTVRPASADAEALVPVLYVALEGMRPTALSARYSLAGIDRVTLGRGTEREATVVKRDGATTLAITIPDPQMSSRHATLDRELGRWVIADAGSKNGTVVEGRAIERGVVREGAIIEVGHTLFVLRRQALPSDAPRVVDARAEDRGVPGMVTLLPDFAHDLAQLRQVARSAATVLIGGESGTGKELVARAVHELSGRTGELVAVNCGAIPQTLVESELFGVRRGAFSGAVEDRPGLVRRAAHGTLFLDEIGDLAPASQAALLRVLQEREVVPVGETRPIAVDFRLVSATLKDLDELVRAGTFRADLLARVSGFAVELPAVRERPEELGLLIGTILERLAPARAAEYRLSLDTVRALVAYDWPMNVRELEKCLETAIALADRVIEVHHLPPAVRAVRSTAFEPELTADQRAQRDDLIEALRRHHGNVSAVARELGKARMQVQRWIRRLEIDPDQYR
jgi:transcriptional regulator with GAF, ATPase, and Fis domain